MSVFLGIDPGLGGGLALLRDEGPTAAHVMPTLGAGQLDVTRLVAIIQALRGTTAHAVVEKVHSMPKQGVASSFKFGRVVGVVEGILAALYVPTTFVTPQMWQKVMHAGIERSLGPKERSQLAVDRLFPTLDLRATPRCKKTHSGLVDALLIAEWGRRSLSR